MVDGGRYRTDEHCDLLNRQNCARQQCPGNSTCVEDFDSARCQCNHGSVGPQCVSVCTIDGLCQHGGRCIPDAHDSRGYRFATINEGQFNRKTFRRCACTSAYVGDNCERPRPVSGISCPDGWWGKSSCGPCNCDTDAGQSNVCDKETGKYEMCRRIAKTLAFQVNVDAR